MVEEEDVDAGLEEVHEGVLTADEFFCVMIQSEESSVGGGKGDSHQIWVRQLRESRRDAALAAVASSVWPRRSGQGTPRAIRAIRGLHPTTHSPTKARVRSRIGRESNTPPRMRSSITGLAAQTPPC